MNLVSDEDRSSRERSETGSWWASRALEDPVFFAGQRDVGLHDGNFSLLQACLRLRLIHLRLLYQGVGAKLIL
jgi:hypothetical protein